MTGGENIFKYITTEGKRAGKRTLREYLEKNTGVFNQKGYIPQEETIGAFSLAKKRGGG